MPNFSKYRRTPPLLSLGSAIRSLRLERDLTQEQLSLIAEVDVSYLGRVERGDNNVAFTTLCKIADGLGVTVSDLTARAQL